MLALVIQNRGHEPVFALPRPVKSSDQRRGRASRQCADRALFTATLQQKHSEHSCVYIILYIYVWGNCQLFSNNRSSTDGKGTWRLHSKRITPTPHACILPRSLDFDNTPRRERYKAHMLLLHCDFHHVVTHAL